jgi:DNA gyrase/topoisomerase IV subunit A
VKKIPTLGRATQGVYIMRMNDADKVVSMSVVPSEQEIDEEIGEAIGVEDANVPEQVASGL